MKKHLLLLLVLFVSVCSNAQIPQYFVGTNVGSNAIPIGGSAWLDNRSQLLYLAGEFGTAPAGLITTIYVRAANSVSATYTNIRVDMGQSNITGLTTAWETGLTTVIPTIPSQVLTGVSGQWMAIPLATPFPYDPTKSLIVDVRQTNVTPATAISLRNFTPVPLANRRSYTTNPGQTSISPTGTVDNGVEYDFGFDLLLSCDSPININTVPTRFTANITWDPRPGASQYEYLIDQSPLNPPSNGYNFTTVPALNLINLPPGTCYYIHARTHCGSFISNWSLDSFCTIAECEVPVVTLDNITSTTAIAKWDAVPGAYGYEYSVGTTPDTPTKGVYTTYTSVKLQGLWPDKPLYVYVRAKCSPTPISQWGTTPFHTEHYTGIEDISSVGPLSLESFPNPVTDKVKLKIHGKMGKNAVVMITDVAGRVMISVPVSGNEITLNTDRLAPGMYIAKYADEDGSCLIKMDKQ